MTGGGKEKLAEKGVTENMDRCPICKEWIFPSLTGRPHRCLPAWHVWISDAGYDMDKEDGKTIYDIDAEEAAKEYAAKYDAVGDYPFMHEAIQVTVERLAHPDEAHVLVVQGEMVPQYQVIG